LVRDAFEEFDQPSLVGDLQAVWRERRRGPARGG
jgi:hypothetical protein